MHSWKTPAACAARLRCALCTIWAVCLLALIPGQALAQADMLDLTAEERGFIAGHPTIRVGVDPGFPPMEFLDREGRPQGMSLDYLRLLEARLGIRFLVTGDPSWGDTVHKLRTRELDVLSCVAETERRKGFMAFTRPYLTVPSVIVVRHDFPHAGNGHSLRLDSLTGRTMAAAEGGYSFDRLRTDFPHIPLLITASPGSALEAVALGKAEAALENLVTASQLIKDLDLLNLTIAGRSDYHEDRFAMGVRSDWPVLVRILNKGLASITPEEHAAILARWASARPVSLLEPAVFSTRSLVVMAMVFGAALLLFFGWNWWLRRQIRAREQAEAALRASEARVAMILAATGDGLWQCDLSTGACHFSSSWYALFGFDPGDMPARWGAFEHLTHPEDQATLQALRDGSCMDVQGRFRVELRMRRKDGAWLPVLARGKVVEHNAAGAPRVVAGVHSDITIRKQTEQALFASEQRARSLFEDSPISLWDEDYSDLKRYLDSLKTQGVTDLRAFFEAQPQALRYAVALIKIRQVNAMTLKLFEAPDEAALVRHLDNVLTQELYDAVLEGLVAFVNGATSIEVETLHRTLTGKSLPVIIRAQFAKGSEQTWDQMLVSVQDITALKEAEALRDEMDRITHHDLKNPLAAIISLPRLLLEDETLPPQHRKSLELLHETGRRMLRMINLSLDLYKMERRAYQLAAVPVDMAAVAADVVAQARAAAQERGLILRLHGEDGPGAYLALGEELLIFSMLSNLVTNAMEASDNGRTVAVTLERSLHWIICRVHNHGAVPDHIREHVFEKHVTTKPGGTGLGCYSARLMAETMRGDIALASSPTAGTTFTVRLPRA